MTHPTLAALLAAGGRLDWGLSNPNKTAALIVWLMLAAWAPAALAKNLKAGRAESLLWYAALAINASLGLCLLLTESRGGVLAAIIGIAILVGFARRPWPRARQWAACTAVAGVFVGAACAGSLRRMEPTYAAGDASIANRLVLWKAAPMMMADAPDGWGAGRAGPAYGEWYQSPERTENYRVLVSTHLTWLVEFPVTGRIAYVGAWMLALWMARPRRALPFGALPLSLLTATGVACQFSSVGEEWWVWPGALAATAACLVWEIRQGGPGSLVKPAMISLGLSTLAMIGVQSAYAGKSGVSRENAGTRFEGSPKTVHLVCEKDSPVSPREWRAFSAGNPDAPTLIWHDTGNPAQIPSGAAVVSCSPSAQALKSIPSDAANIVLIAPRVSPEYLAEKAGPVTVLFGEFSDHPSRAAWSSRGNLRTIEGVGDYLPDWCSIASEAAR